MSQKSTLECLANRIMALRETRCELHHHYLCDVCAAQWIGEEILTRERAARREIEQLREENAAIVNRDAGLRYYQDRASVYGRMAERAREDAEQARLEEREFCARRSESFFARADHPSDIPACEHGQMIADALRSERRAPAGDAGQ